MSRHLMPIAVAESLLKAIPVGFHSAPVLKAIKKHTESAKTISATEREVDGIITPLNRNPIDVLEHSITMTTPNQLNELIAQNEHLSALATHWESKFAELLITRDALVQQVEALTTSANTCGSGAGCLHKDAKIDSLKADAERLNWLNENIFSRENLTILGKVDPTYNMWATFAPKGVQGSARAIIDAATNDPTLTARFCAHALKALK